MRGRRALPLRSAREIHAEAEAPWSTECAAKNPARIHDARRETPRPATAGQGPRRRAGMRIPRSPKLVLPFFSERSEIRSVNDRQIRGNAWRRVREALVHE